MKLITPDWPAPDHVRSVITTRQGGMSEPPWATFNLGSRAGDDDAHVRDNRRLLRQAAQFPSEPQWLRQVHGVSVIEVQANGPEQEGDAAISRTVGGVAAVLTADCLPVLLCDRAGTAVAAIHAGWRGLSAGVIRNTVAAMKINASQLLAFLGPAISQQHFQVGPEVAEQFLANAIDSDHATGIKNCFIDSNNAGYLMADLYGLARSELNALGVISVYGGEYCTFEQEDLFYSYRRDGVTGRMASLIWLI